MKAEQQSREKRNKQFLVAYQTKESMITTWITAKDKLEARSKVKRIGRFDIQVYKNRDEIERIENKYWRMRTTNTFTSFKEGNFVYGPDDLEREKMKSIKAIFFSEQRAHKKLIKEVTESLESMKSELDAADEQS